MEKFEWTKDEIKKCIEIATSLSQGSNLCLNYVAVDNENPNDDGDYHYAVKTVGIYKTKESAIRNFIEKQMYERVRQDLLYYIDDVRHTHVYIEEDTTDYSNSSIDVLREWFQGGDWDDPYYNFYFELVEYKGNVIEPKEDDSKWLKDNGFEDI